MKLVLLMCRASAGYLPVDHLVLDMVSTSSVCCCSLVTVQVDSGEDLQIPVAVVVTFLTRLASVSASAVLCCR